MARKYHLQDTKHYGPTCQGGRSGAGLIRSGEHITLKYSDFSATARELRCDRCNNGRLFAFLERQTAKALLAA